MHGALAVDYDQLQTALSAAGLELSAAEVHGVLCGSICSQMKTGVAPDLKRLLTAGAEVSAESLAPLQGQLENLLEETVQNLYGAEGGFDLLLVDDEQGMPLRVQALADWCRGFLIGLLNNEQFAIDQLEGDTAEIARDMIAISEADGGAGGEDDEWDFAEVAEYVRVGVQLIFEEMHSTLNADSASGELH